MPASSELAVLVRLPERVALHAAPQVRSCAWRPKPFRDPRRGERPWRECQEHPRGARPGATGGTQLEISASGADAVEALERLAELVAGLT